MPELNGTSLFNDANLVGYWRLEGNSNDAKDSHNGTDTDITYNASYGKFGQGLSGNGTSSGIFFTDHADFHPTKFSISAWVKRGTTGVNKQIFASENTTGSGANFYGISFDFNVANKLYCAIGWGTSLAELTSTSAYTDTTLWHHVVVTYDGSNVKFYYDGVLDGAPANTTDPTYTATNYPSIGILRQELTFYNYWNGYIDDVALFKDALTQAEVTSLYIATITTNASFLTQFV